MKKKRSRNNSLRSKVTSRLVRAQPTDEIKQLSSFMPIINKLKEVKKKHGQRTYRFVYLYIIQFLDLVLDMEPTQAKIKLNQYLRRNRVLIQRLLANRAK